MKQRLQIIPIMILFFLLFTSTSVQATEEENVAQTPLSPQELVDSQLKNMDLTELKTILGGYPNEIRRLSPRKPKREFV